MKTAITLILGIIISLSLYGQTSKWQQRVNYKMMIDFDVNTHRFNGKQTLVYYNNSPDTLKNVYYHLYFNAFQPYSMMDVRNRNLPDPDDRVKDRIFHLKENEIGYHKVLKLTQDQTALNFEIEGTVLEVELTTPLYPGNSATFYMEFESQVPKQIRRSGWMNKEGIEYSMSQWYPKMAEYDHQGWHAHPYVGREFYAPWGDFEVVINIDKNYVVGATGILQNPEEIGHGYTEEKVKTKGKNLSWKFIAKNVHDFVWAADPDYTHDIIKIPDGPSIHFFYQNNSSDMEKNWRKLQETIMTTYPWMEKNFGDYPYETYSVIQGGDGGMEYPMATLITGERNYNSLLGVTLHEMMHTWYQMLLATNESYYAWMDEGFTSYTEALIFEELLGIKALSNSYKNYFHIVKTGKEEALSTHADHFSTNMAYSIGSYSKGAISLHQLGYIIGKETLRKGLLSYYNQWRFKHPNLNDFIRVMEKESGLELDWYYEYWINTTHRIDYAVSSIDELEDRSLVSLSKVGKMPMPIDLVVTYKDGSKESFYIPLRIMRGEKKNESGLKRTTLADWPWTHPVYQFEIKRPPQDIISMEIDPSKRMADVNRRNNSYKIEQ